MLVSSCGDNSLAVWDLRKFGKGAKAVAVTAHSRTCQSAYFAPDGAALLYATLCLPDRQHMQY